MGNGYELDGNFDIRQLNALMRPPKMCVCRQVSQRQIRDAVEIGQARSFEEVQALTHCSTGCGTCEKRIRLYLEEILAGHSASL